MRARNLKQRAIYGGGLLALVLALALGAWSHTALASVVKALSLEELTRKADLIVVGVGAEAQARRNDDGRLIVTDVSVDVQQVLKGAAKPGEDVIVTLLGGNLDGLGLRVPGEASIPIGKPALLFLYRSGPGGRDLRVVGMAQGVMAMQPSEPGKVSEPGTSTGTGTMVIIPGGSGSELVERGSDGKLSAAPPALLRPEPAAKVLDRISKIVKTDAAKP
jgi:hypothetical protein